MTTLNKIYIFFYLQCLQDNTYITNNFFDPLTVKFLKYTDNYRSFNTIMKPATIG